MTSKSIVVLASGPSKPDRNRHLEVKRSNGKILIDDVLSECEKTGCSVHIVINDKNQGLRNYVEHAHPKVKVILLSSNKIHDTFSAALSVTGDVIMLCGDLVNVRSEDISKFLESEYRSAICKYGVRWGENLISSTGVIRRSDVGDCISMVSELDKEEFLSSDNLSRALEYFSDFYPQKKVDYEVYNDVGTHLMYTFFHEVWSNPERDESRKGQRGLIYFEHAVYMDND